MDKKIIFDGAADHPGLQDFDGLLAGLGLLHVFTGELLIPEGKRVQKPVRLVRFPKQSQMRQE